MAIILNERRGSAYWRACIIRSRQVLVFFSVELRTYFEPRVTAERFRDDLAGSRSPGGPKSSNGTARSEIGPSQYALAL